MYQVEKMITDPDQTASGSYCFYGSALDIVKLDRPGSNFQTKPDFGADGSGFTFQLLRYAALIR